MAVVTNTMTDEVYEFLEKKANANKFTRYIIELVEKDMEQESYQIQMDKMKTSLNELQSKIEQINEQLNNKDDRPKGFEQESLLNLNFVPDSEVDPEGFDEPIEFDF